jgi:hypothetical protein
MVAHDWFPTDEPLSDGEVMALRFLTANGPHQIGTIDSDEKFAAAFVFTHLLKRGAVVASVNKGGPVYRLTPKGSALLSEAA